MFKQLGITPAQAVRLFFKQVVLTKSIPFSIENQNIDLDQLLKLKKYQLASSELDHETDELLKETVPCLKKIHQAKHYIFIQSA